MPAVIEKDADPILLSLPQPVAVSEAVEVLANAGIRRSLAGVRKRLGVLGVSVASPPSKLAKMLLAMPHPIDIPAAAAELASQGHRYTYVGIRSACVRHGIQMAKAANKISRLELIRDLIARVSHLECRVKELESQCQQ